MTPPTSVSRDLEATRTASEPPRHSTAELVISMSPPNGAGSSTAADAPHAYVDQSSAYTDANATAGAADATRADAGGHGAGHAGIEKDVGTILAGLNQEQLESIVAAAVRLRHLRSAPPTTTSTDTAPASTTRPTRSRTSRPASARRRRR